MARLCLIMTTADNSGNFGAAEVTIGLARLL